VNEALNELLIEEEDYESLRQSIDNYDNFDSIALARKLEKSFLLEFRRISARLYRQNKRWKQSIDLSKTDKVYKDAMDTAMQSGDGEIAEGLLEYFVQIESKHCFAATLFTCYDLIRPDYAVELAWRNKYLDFAFPFLIQVLREYTSKVDTLVENSAKQAEKTELQHLQHPPQQMSSPQGPGPVPVPFGFAPGGVPLGPGGVPMNPIMMTPTMGSGMMYPPPVGMVPYQQGAMVPVGPASPGVPGGLAPPAVGSEYGYF